MLAVALIVLCTVSAPALQQRSAALTIVVIAGEGAVNIIQQKTAVAPIVEVRDRNNQPVAGAVVKFAIQGGRATFNGAKTISVITNAAGQAAAGGLTPTAGGALQIGATAAFQGQAATATILQTNFLTAEAASAAAAGGGAATGGAASGGAAAGGGGVLGMSVTTLGIVGGAVVGGGFLAKELLKEPVWEGPYRMQFVQTTFETRNGIRSQLCTTTAVQEGEVRAVLDVQGDGTVTGTIGSTFHVSLISSTCPFTDTTAEKLSSGESTVTGTKSSLQSSGSRNEGVGFNEQSFTGSFNGDVITGTWTVSGGYNQCATGTNGCHDSAFPRTSVQVTLDR